MNKDQVKDTVEVSKDKAQEKLGACSGNAGQQGKILNKDAEGKGASQHRGCQSGRKGCTKKKGLSNSGKNRWQCPKLGAATKSSRSLHDACNCASIM